MKRARDCSTNYKTSVKARGLQRLREYALITSSSSSAVHRWAVITVMFSLWIMPKQSNMSVYSVCLCLLWSCDGLMLLFCSVWDVKCVLMEEVTLVLRNMRPQAGHNWAHIGCGERERERDAQCTLHTAGRSSCMRLLKLFLILSRIETNCPYSAEWHCV